MKGVFICGKWYLTAELKKPARTAIPDGLMTAADGIQYYVECRGDHTAKKRFVWCHPMASSIANDNAERLWNSWDHPKAASWCTVRMDARGHGQTPPQKTDPTLGDDEFADNHFTWKAVGSSMLAVNTALKHESNKLIVGGASMGGAGALWAACYPGDQPLAGLVMVIPPTCYETRTARSDTLKAAADQPADDYYAKKKPRAIFKTGPPEKLRTVVPSEGVRADGFRAVMLGSAYSNFPSKEIVKEALASVPVLICGWEGDPTHPMSSADLLAELIPHAQVCRATNLADMDGIWIEAIAEFIDKL